MSEFQQTLPFVLAYFGVGIAIFVAVVVHDWWVGEDLAAGDAAKMLFWLTCLWPCILCHLLCLLISALLHGLGPVVVLRGRKQKESK